MNQILAPLHACPDLYTVKSRLQKICEHLGTVQRLDVVAADQAGRRRALCFLRMATAQEDDYVMNVLGIGRFGGDLVLLVELEPAGDELGMGWASMARQGPASSGQAWPRH